jgi:hypothetical protein
LVSGLLSLNPLQHGLLCRGDLDSGRSWSSHHPAHSENGWTIGSEPILWSPPHSGQVLSPPCTSGPSVTPRAGATGRAVPEMRHVGEGRRPPEVRL